MRELSGIDPVENGPVQRAVQHHLDAGGSRTRASMGISVGAALEIDTRDIIATATAAELLHNASLIHDDLQDGGLRRRGAASVWSVFGENIAICAGDLLISASYASLADASDAALTAEYVKLAHAATARVIDGQASDLELQQTDVYDFELYKSVAGGKSGPLLSLPLELAFVSAGLPNYVPVARDAATSLAIAYQVADDLEDEQRDSGEEGASCLNAVAILRKAGYLSPRKVARYQATLALREAMRLSMYLPHSSGEALISCIEAINNKLLASTT